MKDGVLGDVHGHQISFYLADFSVKKWLIRLSLQRNSLRVLMCESCAAISLVLFGMRMSFWWDMWFSGCNIIDAIFEKAVVPTTSQCFTLPKHLVARVTHTNDQILLPISKLNSV